MTFPNPDLGPFEGENKDWSAHVMRNFTRDITSKLLEAHDPAHVALAHLVGFVTCAMTDAGGRGDGKQQIMQDLLAEVLPRLEHLFAGTIGVTILPNAGPLLTVLPGGKPTDGKGDASHE
ncbi:MAG: hypothetical protein EOS36_20180 [Mesorhizobium sp.]|uniref:hypothetical protein n=1 Tax=Mesorhizobium sp. TaxID=1871066 RepID=UPI000FEA1880|nr:hypothetical protein [Mesorhizobium sp.]RWD60677.1 MAG: hypothetical protein EOS36_20180 [Mesorhizobium sp.]